jgi:hypothetical protein
VQGAPVPPVTTSPIPAAGPAGGPVPGAPAPLPPQIAAAVDRVDPQGGMAQGGSQGQFTEAGISSMGAPDASAFPSSLIETESGGNWGALNNVPGAGGHTGHGGRLQFGTARLQEAANAGVVPPMTAQEFARQPPEVQMAVENWHFSDIDNFIRQNGFDQLIGQEINGTPITIDGMRAVAHLGGKGGLARFIETRGGYNPADANGTSLANYFARHGNGGSFSPGGMTETMSSMGTSGPSGGNMAIVMQLAELMGNPYLPEGQRMVAQMLIQQQMGNMDPMRQIQLQQAQMELDGGGMTNNVRASQILTDGTVVQSTDSGVRVFHPARGELTGQEAADAIAEANRQEVENQRAINEGRRLGTYDADIAAGGTAAAAIAGGEAAVAQGVAAYEAYRNISGNIGSIDRAIAALDAGGKSGAFDALLPDITVASAELRNAMDSMGLDVIGAVTFGALSEAELKLAMETAVPRNLDEPQLREWLVARRVAQEKAADMLQNAALFLMTPGNTIPMWIERNRAAVPPAGGDTGARDFSTMSEADLGALDLSTLTPQELAAARARATQLQGGQ